MAQRLEQLRWSLSDLAEATNESYRNVHRWIREDVRVPGHFVSRFAHAVPVNSQWLLTGHGTPEPLKESAAKSALERIAHVLDSVRLTSTTGLLAESAIQSSVDGILAYDADLRYTLWNPAMERITGVSEMAVVGKRVFDVFPHLEGTEVEERLRGALEGRVSESVDQRYDIPESGREGWYEGHYSPLRNVRGEIIGGLCVFRDVTDRKRALVLRREAEERYRTLLRICREAAFLQRRGTVIEANQGLAELAGCTTPSELEGSALQGLFGSRDGDRPLSDTLRELEPGGRVGPVSTTLQRRDGTSVRVTVSAVGVHVDGEPAAQAVVLGENGAA